MSGKPSVASAESAHTGAPPRRIGEGKLRSVIPGIAWPALTDDAAAHALALLYQLEESQWWLPARLLKRQLEQAQALLEHARRSVPFYQQRLPAMGGRLTLKEWRMIPVTTRADLQAAGDRFFARALPPGHAPAQSAESPDSTGGSLRFLTTAPVRAMSLALDLRCAFWHGVDPSATQPSIELTDLRAGAQPYRTEMLGSIVAMQCPLTGLQHVASEAMLLEVLDDGGGPCRPGRTGRVVVTSLHNFASPFIRYDTGDRAEVGSACSCGRGLPVLTRRP